ncbi:unnamed protein product [Ectocarpus sp. 4 AP-2014]
MSVPAANGRREGVELVQSASKVHVGSGKHHHQLLGDVLVAPRCCCLVESRSPRDGRYHLHVQPGFSAKRGRQDANVPAGSGGIDHCPSVASRPTTGEAGAGTEQRVDKQGSSSRPLAE